MRLDVVANRLADAGTQPVVVRAAGSGRDAVDVAANVVVCRLGPLQHQVETRNAVVNAMDGHVIGKAVMVGLFKRPQ